MGLLWLGQQLDVSQGLLILALRSNKAASIPHLSVGAEESNRRLTSQKVLLATFSFACLRDGKSETEGNRESKHHKKEGRSESKLPITLIAVPRVWKDTF